MLARLRHQLLSLSARHEGCASVQQIHLANGRRETASKGHINGRFFVPAQNMMSWARWGLAEWWVVGDTRNGSAHLIHPVQADRPDRRGQGDRRGVAQRNQEPGTCPRVRP